MTPFVIFIIAIALFIFAIIVKNIVVVRQSQAFVVERLGAYHATWKVGVHVKVPFIETIARKISLKEQVADFDPQPVITKDNVTMQIDTVVYFQITDPKRYTYGIEQPIVAIENMTATTLRNILGEMTLDESLTGRDVINTKMRSILDEATDPWGIKIHRVELKNIIPPAEIQNAMEKQMKAERERREQILIAEGKKQSQILQAEGEKQAAILRAEAQKTQTIKEAEGHAESIRLHKKAEADAMVTVKEAEAIGIEKLKEAGVNVEQMIRLRGIDAFAAAADGKATKIIIPSELQGLAGLAASLKSMDVPDPGGNLDEILSEGASPSAGQNITAGSFKFKGH